MTVHLSRLHRVTCRLLQGCVLGALLSPLSAVAEDDDYNYLRPLELEVLPWQFYDFPPQERYGTRRESWWLNGSDWVMDQRDIRSSEIENLGEWLDHVLSGEAITRPDNDSYVRIGMATRWEKSGLVSFEPEARFRVDLPTVREKLRLVVESTPDEFIPLEEQRRDRTLLEPERTDNDPIGALRYLSQITDRWSASSDVGVRLGIPLNPFWRSRFRAHWDLDSGWDMLAEQRVYYFNIDGWGETTRLRFDRNLTEDWHVAAQSEMRWIHDERRFALAQTWSAGRRIDTRTHLVSSIGVLGDSKPNWRTSEYFLDLRIRHRFYKHWLFGEAIPALSFPREDAFEPNPSITFRIEMFFAGEDRFD
ncbi:hypothetical protein QQM79_13585 [Marinobacteraceae bacterium S3BR75-40.1]